MHLVMHWDTPQKRQERGYETVTYTCDGEPVLRFMLGAPEDRNFHRDLRDCRAILALVQEAHAAGQREEPLTLQSCCTPTIAELIALGMLPDPLEAPVEDLSRG